jgi:rhamnulokinase
MKKYYLAVDIGASGGRHILGCIENNKLIIEEVYRFDNGLINKNGSLCWDLENIFREIINGLKQCAQIGKIPNFMGIDTWAVDFVLLDDKDQIIGETAAYRDSRTQGMDDLVYKKIPPEKLYERTGIQRQIFNTIYQLMAIKTKQPHYLEEAKTLLMIPDYLNFFFTFVKKNEYTNATTTQLVNVKTKNWDDELLNILGYKRELFQDISMAGDSLGNFLPGI